MRYSALVAPPRATKSRGRIEKLPSGSLRVKVFAGIDPVSGRKHVLTEPRNAKGEKVPYVPLALREKVAA